MGKRKRNAQNVVKVDLGALVLKKSKALPVLVQHSSKDGRRIEQTVHEIPALPPDPYLLAFDPCPVVTEDEDDVFLGTEPSSEGNEGGRVCLLFTLFTTSLMDASAAVRPIARVAYGT